MSEAFGDWLESLDLSPEDNVRLNMAYISGRAYQREVDAETASSMWISTDIDTDETIYSSNVGDAIRGQKID